MARHRSPSGAEVDDPDRTTALRVVAIPEVRRLPPPPAASTHGRACVAAVAAGAVVAAGQTLASALIPAGPLPITSALLPVSSVSEIPAAATAAPGQQVTITAIGGDQLATATTALDPGAAVDIQSLTKGATIGEKVTARQNLIDAAMKAGAPEAFVVRGQVFVRPALGRFTSGFGARWGTQHYGIDIANAIGTPIYALTGGEVEEAGPASGFGMWVVLRHADGTRSVYGHVNRMFVEEGQQVQAGQQIAEVGNRGQSTGPHLHLEIWDAEGTKLNPVPWLRAHGIKFPGIS